MNRIVLVLMAGCLLLPVAGCVKPDDQGAPCDCVGPDLDCSDFSTHEEAQACYDYCKAHEYGDVFHLDADNDGNSCESLP